jgi:hypothetical protein
MYASRLSQRTQHFARYFLMTGRTFIRKDQLGEHKDLEFVSRGAPLEVLLPLSGTPPNLLFLN